MKGLTAGMETAIWYARVAARYLSVFLSATLREKKKLAARDDGFTKQHNSVTDWAIADLPAPAGACNQSIDFFCFLLLPLALSALLSPSLFP